MDKTMDLRARTEIADVVHKYALAVRRGEPADCSELFTEDASFEVRYADPLKPGTVTTAHRSEGRANVIATITRSVTQVCMFPMIHNLLIEVDGDTAIASSLMIGRMWPQGKEIMGEYADCFRRESGQWRFVSRIFTNCGAELTP